MSATHAFPQVADSDSDRIADALDAGLVHWAKGEPEQAIACLRQAIVLAREEGNGGRADALTRAAGELGGGSSSSAEATRAPESIEPQPQEVRRSKLPEPPAVQKKYSTGGESVRSDIEAGKGSNMPTPKAPLGSIRPLGAAMSNRPSPPSARPASPAPVAPKGDGVKSPAAAGMEARLNGLDHRLASLRVRIDGVEADGTIRLRLLDLAATASGEDNALLVVPQVLWQELKNSG